MSKSSGFSVLLRTIGHEQATLSQERKENRHRAARESARRVREAQLREATGLWPTEREKKAAYQAVREAEVRERNQDLSDRVKELRSILPDALSRNSAVPFDSLRVKEKFPPFKVPEHLVREPQAPERADYFGHVKQPGLLTKLLPGATRRYQESLVQAQRRYEEATEQHRKALADREAKLAGARASYKRDKHAFEARVCKRNEGIDKFEGLYWSGDPDAIIAYFNFALEVSDYPVGFPRKFKLAHVPESKQLVIEYELPALGVVPSVQEYRYVKAKDSIIEKCRKKTELRELYQDVVASVCLRTIHEVFEADQGNHLEVVVFNGFVQTVEAATGKDIKPHLISVRTTKAGFSDIRLSRVDKLVCLRNLGAQVTRCADEMLPVKPVVEFDMVDKRFIEQDDVLSELESRPNLMELNPYEFENLVSNLFGKMGLETKLTRSSKDGGIDAVAYDRRPIIGGKVVIQAKRYKNVVGVAAVRDLYGTMMNEGANKGILVTTSGYGPNAFEFAKDKPIELIDGGGLLYLLEETGVKARIVFPEEGGS